MSEDAAQRTTGDSEESKFVKRCRLYRDELVNHPDPGLNQSYALAFDIAADTIESLQADNDRYFSALASVEMLNQGAEDAMSRWAASGEHHDAHKVLRVQVDNTRNVVEAALRRE